MLKILTPEEDSIKHLTEVLSANGLSTESTQRELSSLGYKMANPIAYNKLDDFITVDPDTLSLKDVVVELLNIDDPVLITGPTGTGKSIIARALHNDRPGDFLAINCAGMPENLIESELFGYVKGSFTGASENYKGILLSAAKGTVFLDEIGEMSLGMQAKLLRVIQDNVVRPVGGTKEVPIECRFVCATNRDLIKLIQDGHFREDLYGRIMTFELYIKGLKERQCDIIPILNEVFRIKANQPRPAKPVVHSLDEIPLWFMENIYKYNVRALHTYARRKEVLGSIDMRNPER